MTFKLILSPAGLEYSKCLRFWPKFNSMKRFNADNGGIMY